MKAKDLTYDQMKEFAEEFYCYWPIDYETDESSPLPRGCPWLYDAEYELGDGTIEKLALRYYNEAHRDEVEEYAKIAMTDEVEYE